jgi:hypothetical protein
MGKHEVQIQLPLQAVIDKYIFALIFSVSLYIFVNQGHVVSHRSLESGKNRIR